MLKRIDHVSNFVKTSHFLAIPAVMPIVIFLYSSLANIAMGQFIPNAGPITIKNQSNKKYKFDADLLIGRGFESHSPRYKRGFHQQA